MRRVGALPMGLEQYLKIAGFGLAVLTAISAGMWKVLQAKRDSGYSDKQRARYERAFDAICVGTVPRLSSFDWRAVSSGLAAAQDVKRLSDVGIRWSESKIPEYDEDIPTLKKLAEADKYIPKYTFEGLPEGEKKHLQIVAYKNWMIERCIRGEEYLNRNRLYIKKEHRDLFREFLVLVLKYADDLSETTLDEIVNRRHAIEAVVMRVVSK